MEMTQGEHHQYVYRPVSASQAMRSRVAGSEADCETAIGWVAGRVFYFGFFFAWCINEGWTSKRLAEEVFKFAHHYLTLKSR